LSGGADGLVISYDLSEDAEAAPRAEVARVEPAATAGNEASRGAQLFKKCAACHTVTPDGGHKAGPSLHRLFGRTAGSRADYPYSEALRVSELVWTEETVGRLFEIGPDRLLPGTKMPLQRMPDADDRAELIAHLKRITAPGAAD
jgi:cytochrome c